jgi:acetyl-CoA carboxylase carboxyl transferase subunit beta
MSLFDWFANRRKSEPSSQQRQEREIADGLWTKCPACGVMAYTKDLQGNQMVCLECNHHLRVYSDERIRQLIDANTWIPLDEQLRPTDPLKFRDRKQYSDRIRETQEKTHLLDAVQTGTGQLDGLPVALGVMDFRFMGGSMGSVVGEKLTRADRASDIATFTCCYHLCLWWGTNARGDAQSDADGKNFRSISTPSRSKPACTFRC